MADSKSMTRRCRTRRAATASVVVAILYISLRPRSELLQQTFALSRRGALAGIAGLAGAASEAASARISVETKASALGVTKKNKKDFELYVEKDPALPKFELLRPMSWESREATLKQQMWQDFGRTLTFTKGNSSVEVAVQPVGNDKKKLTDFGTPEDFAKSFAKSIAQVFAPPSTGSPSPVPTVTPLSMTAAEDYSRLLAQYRFEVPGQPPLIFEQLVGLEADESESSNFLYSLTALAPEEEFDKREATFAAVFRSFNIALRK